VPHRIRKMAGGGMRQAGLLAAAASYALDHHVERLADDHALAQRLASGLQGMAGLVVQPPQTNIVFVDLRWAPAQRICWLILKARRRAGYRPASAALCHASGRGCGRR